MFRTLISIFLIQFLMASVSLTQADINQSMSLDDCIELALTNSLELKGSALVTNRARINLSQVKSDLLPTLNFNYNLGRANGRSIDPFSNDVVTEGLNFSNAGLNLEANVFNGFRIKHAIVQNEQNLQATEMQRKTVKDILTLEVTLAYLQVLNNQDFIRLSKASLETTRAQLARLQVLYNQEVGNPAEYFDMKAQVSRNQLSLIDLENQWSNSLITLANLMNIEVTEISGIQPLDQIGTPEAYNSTAAEIYQMALGNLPVIKTKELEKEAIRTGLLIEKANRLPSLTIFGSLNTNYSSAAQTFSETGTSITSTNNFVQIDNVDIPVLKNTTMFDASSIGYFTQFRNNLNSAFGISLRVPIFNGFTVKNNMALQEIAVKEKDLELETAKQQLRQAIATAHLNVATAYHRYQVLSERIEALRESFRVNEIRFNKGLSNTVEYLMSKNNLDGALLNLSTTMYEYELRRLVLGYYEGA